MVCLIIPSPTTVKGMENMTKPNTYVPNTIMLQWDTGIFEPYNYKTFPTIQDAQEFIKEYSINHWSMWKFISGI